MMPRQARAYLDHNASAPLLPEAKQALIAALDGAANPSSVHGEGRAARALVEAARRDVAALVGAKPQAVTFTSGATEAAATCLSPLWFEAGQPLRLISLAVGATDHPCLRDGGRFEEANVTRLDVDADGQIRADRFEAWMAAAGSGPDAPGELSKSATRRLLALTLANSETGIVQRVAWMIARARRAGVVVVVDAVQAVGRMPVNIVELGADAVILSGHKLGAAKGVGAFIVAREDMRPAPLLTGGSQERRQRAGTEAVAAIASFGAAARVSCQRLSESSPALMALRQRFEARLADRLPRAIVIGSSVERLANTMAISYPGLKAETAQIGLDLAGFAVSSGSACSSGRVGPSHVLKAMCEAGLGIDLKDGAIRVSFGYETSQEQLDRFIEAFATLAARTHNAAAGLAAA